MTRTLPRADSRLLLQLTQRLTQRSGGGRPLELYHWQTVRAGDTYVLGAVIELEECPGVVWRIERVCRGPWKVSPGQIWDGRRGTLRVAGGSGAGLRRIG